MQPLTPAEQLNNSMQSKIKEMENFNVGTAGLEELTAKEKDLDKYLEQVSDKIDAGIKASARIYRGLLSQQKKMSDAIEGRRKQAASPAEQLNESMQSKIKEMEKFNVGTANLGELTKKAEELEGYLKQIAEKIDNGIKASTRIYRGLLSQRTKIKERQQELAKLANLSQPISPNRPDKAASQQEKELLASLLKLHAEVQGMEKLDVGQLVPEELSSKQKELSGMLSEMDRLAERTGVYITSVKGNANWKKNGVRKSADDPSLQAGERISSVYSNLLDTIVPLNKKLRAISGKLEKEQSGSTSVKPPAWIASSRNPSREQKAEEKQRERSEQPRGRVPRMS